MTNKSNYIKKLSKFKKIIQKEVTILTIKKSQIMIKIIKKLLAKILPRKLPIKLTKKCINKIHKYSIRVNLVNLRKKNRIRKLNYLFKQTIRINKKMNMKSF